MVIMENMRKRKGRTNCINDQRGFTMIELLIGVVILSLVIVAIGGFIVVGSRSYAAANTEIILQQEAQLAMNQISDVIIDTTRSVNYAGYNGSEWVAAEKDADFTSEVTDKSLILCNGVDTVDGDGNVVTEEGSGNKKNYQIYYEKGADGEGTLYYSEIEVTEEGKAENFPEDDRVVLAEYVTDFSVDLSQVVEKRVVQISMTYENNNKTYSTSNNITIRNKVGVNEIDVENLDKRVELSVIPKETSVILEPGEEYHFSTPKVTGKNVIDKSVTWSLSDETPHNWETAIKDSVNGIIKIGCGEGENFFKVTITTNATDSEGHHATADVIVYVKRVKQLNLYKSADESGNGPYDISPGCTFTISANPSGNKIGAVCSNCGDDTALDRQIVYEGNPYGSIYVWRLADNDESDDWVPSNYIDLISSEPYSSTWKVKDDLPVDGSFVFVVQACSMLSACDNATYGRHYDWPVFEGLELTVRPKKQSDLNMSGNLRYGDEPLTLNWPYEPRWCAICVRIKTDDPNAPMENDKVMIYQSDGKEIRIYADTFGLDLNHDYYISLQILDYLDSPNGEYYASNWQALADEYNANLDSTGTYIGSLHASSKDTVPLNKPQLEIEYNGKTYFGEELNMDPIYALQGGAEIPFPVKSISNTRDNGLVINSVRLNAYSGEGNNLSGWKEVYCFDGNGYQGNSRIGALDFSPCNQTGDQFKVKLVGNSEEVFRAVGTYHYVPYFNYTNDSRFKPAIYWSNYTPDYDKHLYERPESTVNFTITDKGNLTDLWAFSNDNRFVKGEIYFPVPSDASFSQYFGSRQEYSDYNYFNMISNGNTYGIQFSRMTCKYVQSYNRYELELFYKFSDSQWNSTVERSAGVFVCAPNGKVWNRASIGTLDEVLNRAWKNPIDKNEIQVDGSNTPSVELKDGRRGKAYIPLPSDPAFTNSWEWGLTLGQEGTQTKESGWDQYGFKFQVTGDTNVQDLRYRKMECTYDKNTDTYTIEFFSYDWGSGVYSSACKFKYTSKDNTWTQIK